jgi:hypothetical protein
MNELELPEHELEIFVWRAFKNSQYGGNAIDRVNIAIEMLPNGAHPKYWQAAKLLGDHVLDHMAMRGLVWKDDQGWWRSTERQSWTK